MKRDGLPAPIDRWTAIGVPDNSPNGFVTAFFAVATGFALIWHIWWLAIAGLAAALATLLAFGWAVRSEREISADQLASDARERRARTDFA
jgi:cytochrome o ubiquinol oxidase subunit 1